MTRDFSSAQRRVDVIVPVFNEEAAIDSFHRQLVDALAPLPQQFNIFYVDDGSSDDTLEHLHELAEGDARITVIELSRNFGHQAALCAGIDQALGDFVVTLDGDGQHPPALIAEMLTLAEGGYDIVLTQRMDENDLPFFKRFTSQLFYRLSKRIADTDITPASSDFRLMSRRAVEALRAMPEYHRFLRGMVSWIGFRRIILPFKPPQRLAGESKYSLKKMANLAMNAIFSFSLVPLYVGISIGGLFLLAALAEVIYVFNFWIRGDTSHLAPGWSSLMFMLLVVGGSLMIFMGITGIYIGYIFQEVKHRPIYIIRNIYDKTENQKEQVS